MAKMHGFLYKGFKACQHDDVMLPVLAMLKAVQPQQVIELGTDDGGFTLLLRDVLDKLGLTTTTLTTVDINYHVELAYYIKMNNLNISMLNDDMWLIVPDIANIISSPGRTVVFCDGGDKPSEFRYFATYLKEGDIILAHDYAPTKDYFDTATSKVWRAHEIMDSDIADVCEAHNLQPFMADNLTPVLWACRKKVA